MIRIDVDVTNPGHFFGCCGLFELSERLWPGVKGSFVASSFELSQGNIEQMLRAAAQAPLTRIDQSDATKSPLWLGDPFGLRLDWWKDTSSGGASLKTWAGRMDVHRIGCAMQSALMHCAAERPFDTAEVVLGPDGKKVEPFYFDARRGATAHPLDLGFSPDALELSTIAHPASEFLSLVGLQRFRPAAAEVRTRLFIYRAWQHPLPIAVAAVAAANAITQPGPLLRFENLFRTDQRKHKAFSPAVTLQGSTP